MTSPKLDALDQPIATSLTDRAAWQALQQHADKLRGQHLRALFAEDPARGERLHAEAVGLYLDYSKQRVTDETLCLLFQLAEACGLTERIEAMFRGERINASELRAALRVALRAPAGERMEIDGQNVLPKVRSVLDRMATFCARIYRGGLTDYPEGSWIGHTGKPIRNIVNIGIGSSNLGPSMAYAALRAYSRRGLTFRFVSNIDGADLVASTRDLDPAETLFIVCSRTFTTSETMTNARAARAWSLRAIEDEQAVASHFVAISSNVKAACAFGIDARNVFNLWDWVGDRSSMDSAIGLSTMLAIGPDNFNAMLDGFHAMDCHFYNAPVDRNLPILMGLLTIWNTNFLKAESVAVLPYAHDLKHFPAYLQQLAMESNGKQVTQAGFRVDYSTSPVYWGEAGTDAQHSFARILHQGTRLVACDFIGLCRPLSPLADQHDLLMANLFAQSEALAFGKTTEQRIPEGMPTNERPERVFEGNRPSNTILAENLDPYTLGALVALYEHSIFVQGAIWDIDSFDQWGVDLGQTLASRIASEIDATRDTELAHDSSTNTLIRLYRRIRVLPS